MGLSRGVKVQPRYNCQNPAMVHTARLRSRRGERR